ncbi:MAG: UDP-glucose/GDP-mannose dehydrogenase family protein [Planctomycetes bacterium]|nr:UDP-glucose/GDP-mannose dehydrogenase family protein [Planctomycetota bacterium]
MKVSVIGTGHVGLITGATFAERGNDVLCVDVDRKRIRALQKLAMPFHEPGLRELVVRNSKAGRLRFGGTNADAVAFGQVVFICVPTPPQADGHADMTFVENVSRDIAAALQDYRVIVDKSTVPVLTGERVKMVITRYARKNVAFDVASSPEFLREGSAIEDTLNPDRVVFGVESARAEKVLRELYHNFKAPIVVTDIKSAELIKHASNSFLSMKISYANALAAVCELSGADVQQVTRGMGLDRRIGAAFLSAGIGYGGSCFPKDVSAFEAISRELGYDFRLISEVKSVNVEARERFLKKVQEELWIVKGKTLAALGLSFKPNTDDCRESVAIEIVKRLLSMGARVRAYDPAAIPTAREILGKSVTYCRSAYDAARGADAALVLTEWKEFADLDLAKLKRALAQPVVLDGRNLFDPAKMREMGFIYRSVGRP